MLCRTALQYPGQHPLITYRTDALLRSINDRLGALLPQDASVGADIEPLDTDYLEELLRFSEADNEEPEEKLTTDGE